MQVVGSDNIDKVENNLPKSPDNIKEKHVFDDVNDKSAIPVESAAPTVISSSKLPVTDNNNMKSKIHEETYSKEELVITPEEKASFIESMITGERYKQEYYIFGNKIKLVVRNRTASETQAMYSYIRHAVTNGKENVSLLDGDMSYALIVAQVEELNGTKFSEMKTPLTYTGSKDGEIPPGWLEDLKIWKSKPEGLTTAIINRIQLFEYKYWTMVSEAANKNFWSSDTSTEKSKTLSEVR